MTEKLPQDLLAENVRWANARTSENPDYFRHLSGLQAPDYLWIGCSDSRVPANVITGLEPGEVFVHRNVANIVYAADINCMSAVQFSDEQLKVKHVIVCGHYNCGGVKAVLDDFKEGLVGHWLEPIRRIARRNSEELNSISDPAARVDRLCELNVMAQVDSLATSPVIQNAWDRGQPLSIHGWIYGLSDGRLRNLDCTQDGPNND